MNRFILTIVLFAAGSVHASGGKAPQGDSGPKWSCTVSEGKTLCTSDIRLDRWLEVTSEMKREVESSASASRRLDQEGFEASKRYFSRLNSLALYLEKNGPARAELERAAKASATDLCERAFVSATEWKALNVKCAKNGFYICAEEVRAYPDSIAAIVKNLDEKSRAALKNASRCPSF